MDLFSRKAYRIDKALESHSHMKIYEYEKQPTQLVISLDKAIRKVNVFKELFMSK